MCLCSPSSSSDRIDGRGPLRPPSPGVSTTASPGPHSTRRECQKVFRRRSVEATSCAGANCPPGLPRPVTMMFTKQYKLVPVQAVSKQALHATQWPRVRGLAASAGVWLRATETEIVAALWALVAHERLWLFSCCSLYLAYEQRLSNTHG